MPSTRGYTAGHFALDLDGTKSGFLASAEGGTQKGNIVTEKVGVDQWQMKHVTGVSYDDITFTFGSGLTKAPYKWIADSLEHHYSRKNGAIIGADFDMRETSRMTFLNALVSEITLPGCDAGSQESSKITLKISPEMTRTELKKGPSIHDGYAPPRQKRWVAQNFRFKIDGVPTGRVNKVEAFTVKQKNVEHAVGDEKDFQKEPAYIEVPNVTFTTAEVDAEKIYKWHEDFVIHGKASEQQEKTGSLEYLSPDLKDVLFTVEFYNLGIFACTFDKDEAHGDSVARVKVEMYCDHFKFKMGAGVWG